MALARPVCRILCLALALAAGGVGVARASPTAALCDQAAAYAAQQTGVPLAVLRAITLTETGRKLDGRMQPWPWTVNMEGVGKWFAAPEAALAYAEANFARGARSFDVGCFQLNYRWHGQAFASIEEMFDPRRNALYAARFLARLYAETGAWPKAAAAYHSRTPKFANRYQARFERILARVTGAPPPPPAAPGAEYAHRMASAEPPGAPPGEPQTEAAQEEPNVAAAPLPLAAPRPSPLGSLAALDRLPQGTPLLTAPSRRLY